MIEPLSKGSKTRTAQHAAVMNEIIRALNDLETKSVIIPDTCGVCYVKDGRFVIDLSPMAQRINLLIQAGGGNIQPL